MTHPTDQPLPELKPCPFCGETPSLTKHFKLDGHYSMVHRCKVVGPIAFDFGRPDMHAKSWNTRTPDEEAAAELARLRADNENLRSVMIAAAEEILEHWDAHCDADGYGPANLMHRLEAGIPSEYGYKAGDFARLRAEVEELRQRFRTYSFGQVVRLSDPEMKATVDAIKRRIKEEPGFGKALLQSAGILDAKGGFAEMYADAALTNRND